MKLKSLKITLATIAFSLLTAMTVPATANADCSYNGYLNSNGRCEVSYRNTYTPYQYTNYSYRSNSRFDEAYIRATIARLEAMIALLENYLDNDYDYDDRDGKTDLRIATRAATNIEDESATLWAKIYLEGEDEATVWFEYGTSNNSLRYDTAHRVVEEDDDDLFNYDQKLANLDEDTKYYFRAVAEDEDGDKVYGKVLSFRTDDNRTSRDNDDEKPEPETDDAEDITDDSAELHGSVDMNDFNNGTVFFVYGEDEELVDDIEDEYDEYRDIDEDGDDLQKVKVDSDLDGRANYWVEVPALDNDTKHYFAICVEYEDEDDDQTIECGSTEDFRTDD
ncbi:fibronectin type III domain-containing protein [Candidatus Kaiserbacteria bacterium]|nr:fibronectin type III domain-containing protein [Candidatus Kaiserbacteria bacterium]